MISDEIGLAIMKDCNSDNASKSCNDARNEANDIVGDYIDSYDVILDVCYPSIAEQELRLKRMVQFPLSFRLYILDTFLIV